MRVEGADISNFLEANQRTTVIQLIPYILQGGQSGLRLLSEIAKFQKQILDCQNDIQYLASSYLVWHKPNNLGEADWNRAGCTNYTVAEYADSMLKGDIKREDIMNLVASLKTGLSDDIVLVTAVDTILDKRLIVDGCKRAVALVLIDRGSRQEFSRLFNSRFHVVMMELRSRWAHVLYPCDFLHLCNSHGVSDYLNYTFEIMRENQSFLLSKDKGKQTCDEVIELCNDAIDEVYIFAKRKDATEEFAKLALLSFIFHVLMPQSNALYVNLLLGNIPACFAELRLMTESLAKCYLADIKFPEQSFFPEKLQLLEEEGMSTSRLLKNFDKRAVVLWSQLSQEWVHTKGIMNRVVTQIAQKSGVPGWALALPTSYTDDDMNMVEELRRKVSQFRALLKATIDSWERNVIKGFKITGFGKQGKTN